VSFASPAIARILTFQLATAVANAEEMQAGNHLFTMVEDVVSFGNPFYPILDFGKSSLIPVA